MDLAIAINTTAFQPGMFDKSKQSLIVLGSRRFWLGYLRLEGAELDRGASA